MGVEAGWASLPPIFDFMYVIIMYLIYYIIITLSSAWSTAYTVLL